MLYLDTYIKPFVDPDTYSTYQPIIAKLGTRGHKDPQYRVESHARLEKLVQGDEDMKELITGVRRCITRDSRERTQGSICR
jgi:hypothetical protein